jgi:hypothetical protein
MVQMHHLDRREKMRVSRSGIIHVREATVTSRLRNIALFAVMMAAIAVGAGRPAAAMSFEDISGKWCGSVSSYTFTPGKLIVLLYEGNQRFEYKIDDYQYEDSSITVNWRRGDDKLFTKFSEFSGDDKTMAQQQNNAGPRREFRRCS